MGKIYFEQNVNPFSFYWIFALYRFCACISLLTVLFSESEFHVKLCLTYMYKDNIIDQLPGSVSYRNQLIRLGVSWNTCLVDIFWHQLVLNAGSCRSLNAKCITKKCVFLFSFFLFFWFFLFGQLSLSTVFMFFFIWLVFCEVIKIQDISSA